MSSQVDSTSGDQQTKSLEKAGNTHKHWYNEVVVAEKEQKKWHERGRKITKQYLDERDAANSVDRRINIFTTNVEIMQSALYAQIPKVEVKRRFNDMNDDVANCAANIIQRMIEADLNKADNDFDRTMFHCVEDRLIPGGGFAWLRYEPEIETVSLQDPLTGEAIEYQEVTDHYVCVDYVYWEDFLYSPCRIWEERRWSGRRVYMDYDSLVARFGKEKADQVPLDYSPTRNMQENNVLPEHTALQRAVVYELWDRTTKKVIWFNKGYSEILDIRDDPLQLDRFEPCPRPLFARTSNSNFVPVADYYILQDQYQELDTLNNRISLLVAACKVVGVYDRSSDGVQKMLVQGTDNTLIPVDNWAMFAEKGGIKGQVDWLPLEQIVVALEKLQFAAERVKQQIYEISGISDIMRGSSNPYEGVGAQQIKAQFASARLQRQQNEIARFAGDILSIKAEIMVRHFPPEFMVEKSNIQFSNDAELIPQAMQLIDNEEKFGWRVNIVPDSMALVDYNQEKQMRTEFITAVSGFLQNAIPAMSTAPQLMPFIATLMKFGIGGFKNTQGLEFILDKYIDQISKQMEAQQNQPKQPSPEEQKVQMEMQKIQAELQAEMQRTQADLQKLQAEMQMKQQEHQADMQYQRECAAQELQIQHAKADQEMQIAREKAALDAEVKTAQAHMKAAADAYATMAKMENEPAKES